MASDTEIPVSVKQCEALEAAARGQATSRVWFWMRIGRITASKLKAVCSTDPAMPSLCLIMSVCHPRLPQFQTTATICEHESKAREKYKSMYTLLHQQFSITVCGFFIHPDHPFMGTSPDGLVSLCCGEEICEIKVRVIAFIHVHAWNAECYGTVFSLQCPYSHRNDTIEDAADSPQLCLETIKGEGYQLKRAHTYYFQVYICMSSYRRPWTCVCVFIIFTYDI